MAPECGIPFTKVPAESIAAARSSTGDFSRFTLIKLLSGRQRATRSSPAQTSPSRQVPILGACQSVALGPQKKALSDWYARPGDASYSHVGAPQRGNRTVQGGRGERERG
jgi:hypothetical protein